MLHQPPSRTAGPQNRPRTPCRPLRDADVAATAELHDRCLGEGLFPRLGRRFLRRWHLTFVATPHASAHAVTEESGELLAFILATTDQRRYVSHTLDTARWPLVGHGLLALSVRPLLALRFARTRLGCYSRRVLRRRPSPQAPTEPVAVVHAIITSERARGRGLGRRLLERFEADVVAAGVRRMELVTEADGGAAEFYRRVGWTEDGVHVNRDGRRMLHFHKTVGG